MGRPKGKHSKQTRIRMSIAKGGSGRLLTPKEIYSRKLYYNLRRYHLKAKVIGSHMFGEWENLKAQYDWTCPSCCKKEPEITLTQDHIIPVSKGGSDNIENIQPLYQGCNSKKHTKTIKFNNQKQI